MHYHFIPHFDFRHARADGFNNATPFMPHQMGEKFSISFQSPDFLQLGTTQTADQNPNFYLPDFKVGQFNITNVERFVYFFQYGSFHMFRFFCFIIYQPINGGPAV